MKNSRGWVVKKCMDCGKEMKRFRKLKGRFICFSCYQKKIKFISMRPCHISLEKALAKTYELHGYLTKDGQILCQRGFPSILIGHKVKLVLVK